LIPLLMSSIYFKKLWKSFSPEKWGWLFNMSK